MAAAAMAAITARRAATLYLIACVTLSACAFAQRTFPGEENGDAGFFATPSATATTTATDDCARRAEETAEVCGNVLSSNNPYDLLTCCNTAKVANDLRCFCKSNVRFALGDRYDITIATLEAGCDMDLASFGTVACVSSEASQAAGGGAPQQAWQPPPLNAQQQQQQSADSFFAEQPDTWSGQQATQTAQPPHAAPKRGPQPVARWTFGGDGKDMFLTDAVGEANGYYLNAVETEGGPRPESSAASFNGRNYAVIPYNPTINAADFSIAATVMPKNKEAGEGSFMPESIIENFYASRPDSVVSGGYGLDRHWKASDDSRGLAMTPHWAFVLGTPVGPVTLLSNSEATAEAWHHIVGSYDEESRTASLYVNGDLEDRINLGSQGMLGNPEADLLIGKGGRRLPSGGQTVPYVGRVAEAAFYDAPLTQAEASRAFKAQALTGAEEPTSKMPVWAIALTVACSAAIAIGVIAGFIVWRVRRRSDGAPTGSGEGPSGGRQHGRMDTLHTSALPNALTSLKDEEVEPLTPQRNGSTAAEAFHPRFRKVGSRISVSFK